MMTPARISYTVLALTLVLAGVLHLGPALLALLLSYFALRTLVWLTKKKWLALICFVLLAAGITYAAGHFTRAAVKALPEVADHSIPSASAWAEARQIELPFTDFDSLRTLLINAAKEQAHYLRNVTRFAENTTEDLHFIVHVIHDSVTL